LATAKGMDGGFRHAATMSIAVCGFLISERGAFPPQHQLSKFSSRNLPFPKVIDRYPGKPNHGDEHARTERDACKFKCAGKQQQTCRVDCPPCSYAKLRAWRFRSASRTITCQLSTASATITAQPTPARRARRPGGGKPDHFPQLVGYPKARRQRMWQPPVTLPCTSIGSSKAPSTRSSSSPFPVTVSRARRTSYISLSTLAIMSSPAPPASGLLSAR
jgi:hypothetical protein